MSTQPNKDEPHREGQFDPIAFGEWFAHATEDERRKFADAHGDTTAAKRDRRKK